MTELRPRWSGYRKAISRSSPALVVVAVALVVGAAVGHSWIGFSILLGLVVVTIGLCLGYVAMLVRVSRIRLSDDQIEYRGWSGRTTVLSLGDRVRGVLTDYRPPMGRSTSALLILQGDAGGCRIRLNGGLWSHEDLETIASAAGVGISAKVMLPHNVESLAPGILWWWERHPFLFFLAGFAVTAVLVAVAILAVLYAENEAPFHRRPPRVVSARTVADQNAIVRGVSTLAGGRWSAPKSRLVACGQENVDEGWRRFTTTSRAISADPVKGRKISALVAPISAVLTHHGFGAITTHRDGDGIDLSALPTGAGRGSDRGPDSDAGVQLELAPDFASLQMRGRCETPSR